MSPLRFPASLAFAAAAVLLAGCGQKSTVDPEESASLTSPVARFEFLSTPKVPPGNRTGEEVYKGICTTCHATGTLGAPTTGDAAAWAPRIATGYDTLVQSVIGGKGNMTPRAGSVDLTDTEIRRGVAWLANQAGAHFTEPPLEQ
ncbi:MAG: c-type cytochrome [Azoarcus sp.]|nr:c-type cytochrome [Azoarcus sp.]